MRCPASSAREPLDRAHDATRCRTSKPSSHAKSNIAYFSEPTNAALAASRLRAVCDPDDDDEAEDDERVEDERVDDEREDEARDDGDGVEDDGVEDDGGDGVGEGAREGDDDNEVVDDNGEVNEPELARAYDASVI